MADPVKWGTVAAILDDPDVSSQTKAALLDAYAAAEPNAMKAHADAFARYGATDSATPPGTPPRQGPFLPGQDDNAPLSPDLGGLGIPTVDAPDIQRWKDTRAALAQAKLESNSVAKVAALEKKLKSGPDAVDTADELLVAGRGGLQFFRLFLPAYNRLTPLKLVKFADYQTLYDAENGLDFAVFLADSTFVDSVATTLTGSATDLTKARDRLVGWGGEPGTAARGHLGSVVDRINELVIALSDGPDPTALAGLLGKGVGTLQNAVLNKASTVAALKSSTVFSSPALTPAEVNQLIDAVEPDATDDILLDAAAVMRADQMPASSLLNPAVRIAIRTAAETWTDGFLQWFGAVDHTFRTACSTAGTAVAEALKTMAQPTRCSCPTISSAASR